MKIFKKCLLFIIVAILSITTVKADSPLSIEGKEYDENSCIATISGESEYKDVMVSLFDGEELLAFKTVQTNNNDEYTATFNITFAEDKTIIVKVGDINETDYKMTTMDVKKSVIPVKSNKLTDANGNSLTILDSLKKFETNDELSIQVINDFSGLGEDEKAMISAIENYLGAKNKLYGVMLVEVYRGGHSIDLDEVEDGYKLFLNLDKDFMSQFKKPYISRAIDLNELRFEGPKALKYDDSEKGVSSKINTIGVYILYDDISIDYKFLDSTADQTYVLKGGDTLTLRVDADFAKFVGVYVDGKLVDKANYTATSGSTVITFSKEYMQSLSTGVHDIKVDFTDGQAITTVNVLATNPKTGDNLIMFASLLVVSISGIALVSFALKRKANN